MPAQKRPARKPATKSLEPRIRRDDAVELYGSAVKLAAALGVTKQAVGNWAETGYLPPARAYQLLRLAPRRVKPIVKMVPVR
ncbi:MAG: Cro/CI family transcriptional regulator [Tagaea sp.]